MQFQPLKNRIVVKRDILAEKHLESGLIIPEKAQEKPQRGTILACGPDVKDLKVYDYVIFGKHDGTEVTIEDENVLIMKESHIWAIEGTSVQCLQ